MSRLWSRDGGIVACNGGLVYGPTPPPCGCGGVTGGTCPENSCCSGGIPCAFDTGSGLPPVTGSADGVIEWGPYHSGIGFVSSAAPYQSTCLNVSMDNEHIAYDSFGRMFRRIAYQTVYNSPTSLSVICTLEMFDSFGDGHSLVRASLWATVNLAPGRKPCLSITQSEFVFNGGQYTVPMNFNGLTLTAVGPCPTTFELRWYTYGTVGGDFFYSQGGFRFDYRTVCSCGSTAVVDDCLGRCCLPGGGCVDATLAQCQAAGGSFAPGFLCATAPPCPVGEVLGMCCRADGCSNNSTQSACDAVGGVFFPGQVCSPSSCLGACCEPSGACTQRNGLDCFAVGGVFYGPGTECADTDCVPVPPCCSTDGHTCFIYDPGIGGGWPWDVEIRLRAHLYRNTGAGCAFDHAADQSSEASGFQQGDTCNPTIPVQAGVTVFGYPGTSADNMTASATLVLHHPGGPPVPYVRVLVTGGGVPPEERIVPVSCEGGVFDVDFTDRGTCVPGNPNTLWQWRNIRVNGLVNVPTGRSCSGNALPRPSAGGSQPRSGGCSGCGGVATETRAGLI